MRARATALGLVSAAAVFAATHACAQQPGLSAENVATNVAQQIEEIQSSQGITSPELIDPLTNMGLIFREQRDVALAIATFERARHIVRVNYGLSSFKEAPLLRQLVQIEDMRLATTTARRIKGGECSAPSMSGTSSTRRRCRSK